MLSVNLKPALRVILTSIVLSAPLMGCFQPMYGGPSGQALVEDFRAIKVEPIAERIGHYLGNELIFLLNGTGAVTQARCALAADIDHQQGNRTGRYLGLGQRFVNGSRPTRLGSPGGWIGAGGAGQQCQRGHGPQSPAPLQRVSPGPVWKCKKHGRIIAAVLTG